MKLKRRANFPQILYTPLRPNMDNEEGNKNPGKKPGKKKTGKQPVTRQTTLFGLPGFDVSVNKINKKTRKVISSYVRKDVAVGKNGVAKSKFVANFTCEGCERQFNSPQGLGGHQKWLVYIALNGIQFYLLTHS